MTTAPFAISVVILSHNRLEDLRKNLQIWTDKGISGLEIIVVDNASSDGSAQFLRELDKVGKIKAVLHDANLGVAAGRNAGFHLAKGEIILCLDDDAYLSPAGLDKIARYFHDDKALGALSLSVIHAVTGEKQNPHGNKAKQVANYHGAAHVFRTNAIVEIGYLDELCTFGGEELDSCIRLYDKGYHCLYTPEMIALHN